MRDSNPYIVTGDSPEVMKCLGDPETKGVIWHGAFTPAAVASARHTLSLAVTKYQPDETYDLKHILRDGLPGTSDFLENLKLIKRFFAALTQSDHGTIYDNIRSEPFAEVGRAEDGDWHVDIGKFVALGVPVGPGTQYLPQPLPGGFDDTDNFLPDNPEDAEQLAETLPHDALLIMKCQDQYDKPIGVVHRRPCEIIRLERADRLVIHFRTSFY